MDRFDLIVGGEHRDAADGAMFAVQEPARGEPMAEGARAGVEDAHRAIAAARRAFDEGPWPRTSATERGRVLQRVAALVRERLETIATVEARNGGKPIRDACDEISAVAAYFE